MSIPVTQEDREAAQKFALDLDVRLSGTQLHNLAGVLAQHRVRAAERMRATCIDAALHGVFIQARNTEWDDGVNTAKREIAAAIRAIPTTILEKG